MLILYIYLAESDSRSGFKGTVDDAVHAAVAFPTNQNAVDMFGNCLHECPKA